MYSEVVNLLTALCYCTGGSFIGHACTVVCVELDQLGASVTVLIPTVLVFSATTIHSAPAS